MAGLVDGLGGEELGQAGSQVSSAWITGSIISQSDISGVNVYATTLVKAPTVLGSTTVSGVNVYATTISGTTVKGGNAALTGSVVANSKRLSPVGAGSPTNTWGLLMQTGSNVTGAGSNLWLKFPTAFSATPKSIIINGLTNAGSWLRAPAGSWHAGSMYLESFAASETFSWMAVGAE